ncbi:MAG: Asp-tRNA(Asn)/Glu-tRNA(Gln) amidotransferase subunit GatB [Patescibacteria group bacterium]
MLWKPVIGLETHIQLNTKSKLFCSCPLNDGDVPNTNVCPICLGHPGTLPVLNQQAITSAVKLALGLNGEINKKTKFDRKNYFYPDLPKAYQISQFDHPIMYQGELSIDLPNGESFTVQLERMHLEEDAAKNIHSDDGQTYVDYNRGGAPLCEIVTRPVFTSSTQAKAYLQELRTLVRTLKVSDGNLEKGQMRCDVNLSMRAVGADGVPLSPVLNPKTEVKNVNSFRAVERVIEYEIKRQTALWEAGTPPLETTTRGWNDVKQVTESQRTKENSAEYRYFPEPDLPPLDLTALILEVKRSLGELPPNKRARFVSEYGFKPEEARQIVEDPTLADFAEQSLSELGAWLEAHPDITSETMPEHRFKAMKTFVSWLLNKLPNALDTAGLHLKTAHLTPENFAQFISLLVDQKLAAPKGLEVLTAMIMDGSSPTQVAETLGAGGVGDLSTLIQLAQTIAINNPKEVERYQNGEKKLLAWLVGQLMRETKGNANPELVTKAWQTVLGE